jgi:hypothetical protein
MLDPAIVSMTVRPLTPGVTVWRPFGELTIW